MDLSKIRKMIQKETVLNVADNSGVLKVRCISLLKGASVAHVGDIIVVSARKVIPNGKITKGDKFRAIVVREKSPVLTKDGGFVNFHDNAVVLINKETGGVIGTQIKGVVSRVILDKGYNEITSKAIGVL